MLADVAPVRGDLGGRPVLTIGQLLAIHAIVTGSRVPGRDGLLAALDREIDNHPRPTEESES